MSDPDACYPRTGEDQKANKPVAVTIICQQIFEVTYEYL